MNNLYNFGSVSRAYAILLDLIRMVNIINMVLIMGIFLSKIGVNPYVGFVIVTIVSGIAAYISRGFVVKRIGEAYG